jgi:F-type H+-transporting ATPase subunit a
MKKLFIIFLGLLSTNTFANEGFTWLSQLAKVTGIEEQFHAAGIHHFEHVLTFSLVGILLVIAGLVYRSKTVNPNAAVIPDRGITFKNIVELYGSFIYAQTKAVLGEKEAPKHFQFVATIFILIFISNLIGLIPGFLPPTETINTTMPLGFLTFFYFNFKGMKEVGVLNYFKHFAGPLWYLSVLIFPIEIISTCIRPISLSLRLYGNMFGDHMVLSIFSGLAPAIIPIVFLILGLLVCFIQAYVFTILSMVYISLATAHHDHGEQHAHH